MHVATRNSRLGQLGCGAFLLSLGILGVCVFSLQPESTSSIVGLVRKMGLNTPMLFCATGLALLLSEPREKGLVRSIVRSLLLAFALLLSLALFAPTISALDFGIDFVRGVAKPTIENPHPGRPAPNTSLCFAIATSALIFFHRRARSYKSARVLSWAGGTIIVVAFLAALSYGLELGTLYPLAKFNTMLPTTAAGLAVLGAGMILLRSQLHRAMDDTVAAYSSELNSRVAASLIFVTACTAAAGFAVLRGGLEQSVLDNIELTATANATSLANTLEGRLWFPKTIASRPSVVDTLIKIRQSPGDSGAAVFLGDVATSFLTAGIGYVRFSTPDGRVITERGVALSTGAEVKIVLDAPGQRVFIYWKNGYILSVENEVLSAGQVIGRVTVEERLLTFDKLVTDIQKSGPSADVLICGRENNDAVCAPSRLYAQSKRIPMFIAPGKVNLPINRALLGESGTLRVKDLRGVPVLAAYTPVGKFALGMVVKVDEVTIYTPMRKRFAELAGVVVLIILLGVLIVRVQVQPVLNRLIREQTRNKVILANSNDAFIALDALGLVRDWNARAAAMFGWSENEAVGRDLSELIIPPASRAAHGEGLRTFAATGAGPVLNQTIEVIAMRKDGSSLPVELSVTGYREGENFVSNAFVRDITGRKLAETKIRESQEFLRSVTDNIPAFVAYADLSERYRFANATYKYRLGTAPEDMVGKTIGEVVGDSLYSKLKPSIALVLSGKPTHFELSIPIGGDEESSHLMFDYTPDWSLDGKVIGFHILVNDISERKNAELLQAASEKRADLANRAKSEFVANMSHEIRTPMNAVLGISHLLRATTLTSDQHKYLDMVTKSGDLLMSILNDVLDFSKIEAGHLDVVPAPFVLNEILSSIATLMTVNAGAKNIELALGVEKDVPFELVGDRFRIEQILANLVSNAIKFTDTGEVSLLVAKLDNVETDGVSLCFSVRDTGLGMSEEHISRVFNAFEQADASMTRRFGGTGLGLTISRKLARLMGGDITVVSETGRGSHFTLNIELGRFESASQGMQSVQFARPLRLLVVDDNETSRSYVSKTIERWGWQADTAGSGVEALRHISKAENLYDVVICDFDLPDVQAFAERIPFHPTSRQRTPIILMVSAFHRYTLPTHGASMPDAVLLKPVTGSSVFDALHEVLSVDCEPRRFIYSHPSTIEGARLLGTKILLVEDNELNQVVAHGILTRAGAAVTIADNGQAAVDLYRKRHTDFDIILMDVQMPVMDGFEAARLISTGGKSSPPIIAMTAGVMADEREHCVQVGMVDFIGKPIDVEHMLETISKWVKSSNSDKVDKIERTPPMEERIFNISSLLALTRNNAQQGAALVQLVRGVVEKAEQELDQARDFWMVGESEKAARLIHGLRGSVGSLGAKDFASATKPLESAIRSGSEDVLGLFTETKIHLSDTVAAASDWLKTKN